MNQERTQLTTTERQAVADCSPSLLQLYQTLQPSQISTMVSSPSPTLDKIKNKASLADARSLVSLALCDLCDFFNVGKNMDDRQIAATADLIIDRFWYFKVEELKFCFRQAKIKAKLYDRLDGNIIMQWLEDYDVERTNIAAEISRNREAEQMNKESSDGVSWLAYVLDLKSRSLKGDKEASQRLDDIEHLRHLPRLGDITKDKETAFKEWYCNEYLRNKSK